MDTERKARAPSASEQTDPARLVVRTRIKPPLDMSKAAKAKWREIVNSLPADYFTVSDRSLFGAYCVNAACFDDMTALIDRDGALIDGPKGRKVPNPAIWVRAEAFRAMAQASIKLRLAPSSRMDDRVAATKVAGSTEAKRPWERTAA